MAISYTNSFGGYVGSTPSSYTYSFTTSGTNRGLVVGVGLQKTGGVTDVLTGITYGGTAMTYIDKYQVSSVGYDYFYYLANPATGANNVVISLSSAVTYIFSCCASYAGVSQTGMLDNSSRDQTASGSSLTTSVTSVADNCWNVLYVFAARSDITAGTGSTNRATDANASNIMDSNSAKTPEGSYSMSASWSSSAAVQFQASIAPYVAASGPANVKTWNGLAQASVKTVNGLAIASVKSRNGIT